MNAPLWSDRAAGTVLGGAAGDALGAGYEFGPPLAPGAPVGPYGGGIFGWEPGEWTDDTQMATAVLSALAAGPPGDEALAAVATGFIAWLAGGPRDVGNQTRTALGRAAGDPAALADAARAAQAAHPDAAGNGSLMRTGPAGLAPTGSRQQLANFVSAVSDLTHPHADCAAACVLWCDAIHRFRTLPSGGPAGGWVDHLRVGLDLLDGKPRDRWSGLLTSIEGADPAAFARNNGWVVDAFRHAVAVLETTPLPDGPWASWHLRRSLEQAVRGGGDTDTVAAIAGSLAGAAWGATAVPLSWQLLLHGTAVSGGEVGTATGRELAWRARLASIAGTPDTHGWPGDAMLPYYGEQFPADPSVTWVDDHLAVGNVHGINEVDAGLVVSLCRMGRNDVRPGPGHLEVGLLDSTDPADNPNLVPLLADVARVVDEAADRRSVYLHCVRAEHRTPAALAAVLVRRGASPDTAAREAEAVTRGDVPSVFRDALTELARAREEGLDW